MPRRWLGRWRAGLLREPDWEALLLWLATRLGVIVLGTVGAGILFQDRPLEPFLDRLRRWDAEHLITIARYGYAGDPAEPPDAGLPAFFPGQPLALRMVHMIVPDWVLAGVLISLVAGGLAMVALSRLGELAGPPGTGRWAVLALLLCPTSVFLFAGYSEALFLAFAIPAWLAARQGRWRLACLLAAGASCVRITGLFLGCALIVEYVAAGRRDAADAAAARAGVRPVLRVGAGPGGAPAVAAGEPPAAGARRRDAWWRRPGGGPAWLAVPFVPLVLYSAYQYLRTGDLARLEARPGGGLGADAGVAVGVVPHHLGAGHRGRAVRLGVPDGDRRGRGRRGGARLAARAAAVERRWSTSGCSSPRCSARRTTCRSRARCCCGGRCGSRSARWWRGARG